MKSFLLPSCLVAIPLLVSTVCGAGTPPNKVPIGALQGVVQNQDDAETHRTPLEGERVTIQGVAHSRTLNTDRRGLGFHGFFLQNRPDESDGNPNTSDAVFIDLRGSPALRAGGRRVLPQAGDELILSGTADELFSLTALREVELVSFRSDSSANLLRGLKIESANPPPDVLEAARYWERREGMLMRVPAGAEVQGGLQVFRSSHDSEIRLLPASHPVLARKEPYHRRLFRDAHPLDDIPDILFDNGNGSRVFLGGFVLKAQAVNPQRLLPAVRTFDRLKAPVTGAVHHAFGKYVIHPDREPEFIPGADPADNHPLTASGDALRVAVFNLENLYDFRDDPTDANDFHGNPGANGVRKPFDYVPASDAVYRLRLKNLATQILQDLHAPDLLLVQEIEDQDIGGADRGDWRLSPRLEGNGQPDVLEELALEIQRQGGPDYLSLAARQGVDYRGINCAFMLRTDRVELDPDWKEDPLLGGSPVLPGGAKWHPETQAAENPKAFNAALPASFDDQPELKGRGVFSRAAQLLRVRRVEDPESPPLYLLTCHLSSGPNRRVERRTEQARLMGLLCQAILKRDPDARIVAGGDYNVFPRPDDPFSEELSDQLGPLYEVDMRNLHNRLLKEQPASAYTYVYNGQAGTLDQIFYSPALSERIVGFGISHINSDWTTGDPRYPTRGASDHDPLVVDLEL